MPRNITEVRVLLRLVVLLFMGMGVVAAGLLSPVLAVTDEIQGYHADSSLEPGTVVELTDDTSSPRRVGVASKERPGSMFGVVVDHNRLSFTLSDGDGSEIYVATSGTHPVLVSTENGEIMDGDYLTPSSIDGTLMKADTRQQTIFGRAASSFTASSVPLGSMTLKDDQGASHTVRLGSVSVTIDIKENPNKESTKVNVPEFLEDIGQQIAKKEVSPIRIYLSLLITAVSLITAIVVLYSGVRNSLISIGRNPMSKRTILRALLEIILTSIAVLMVGLFAVYLLLRL